jgi:hypothetical protein
MTITQKASPGFDYETTKSYTCYIFVMDGHNVAVMDKVTINIEDVPEDPTMNLPASGKISVPELHCYGCHLYDVCMLQAVNLSFYIRYKPCNNQDTWL